MMCIITNDDCYQIPALLPAKKNSLKNDLSLSAEQSCAPGDLAWLSAAKFDIDEKCFRFNFHRYGHKNEKQALPHRVAGLKAMQKLAYFTATCCIAVVFFDSSDLGSLTLRTPSS